MNPPNVYDVASPRAGRAEYGRQVRLASRERLEGNMLYSRFQYGGYWFTFLDPYPEYWGDTWYQNDDVYVDGGYYLFNRRYPDRPGVAISISVD
jgi:hypothetical protein